MRRVPTILKSFLTAFLQSYIIYRLDVTVGIIVTQLENVNVMGIIGSCGRRVKLRFNSQMDRIIVMDSRV